MSALIAARGVRPRPADAPRRPQRATPLAPASPVLDVHHTLGNAWLGRLVQGRAREAKPFQPAAAAPRAVYRQQAPPSPRLRLPTLEVFSARSGGALARGGTPLTEPERTDALDVFGSSIDLDRVRVVVSPVVAAPTTLGNVIRIPPGYGLPRWVLIHELTHVWQYQTKGTGYISDSLWHQAIGAIVSGSRHAAGAVAIEPGKSMHGYTAEQQAVIVSWYFQDPSLKSDPQFSRLLDQVRRARPLPVSLILEEAAFGPGMGAERWRSMTESPAGGASAGPGVPLIRVEF